MVQEITIKKLNPHAFIKEKIKEIQEIVRDEKAVTALSGGVDSSVVTMLGHKALGDNLVACFIENGLMRHGEPEAVVSTFSKLGIPVTLFDRKQHFFEALCGITDPERKREAITSTFYRHVFPMIVAANKARYLLQGTILTDIEETAAGIKRQHNVFEQIGINPEKAFGYRIIEPLTQLRKHTVRVVAEALGLPLSITRRMPFPGPALAARVIGEVTSERIELVRRATAIVEDELQHTRAFQYMAILHDDEVTGMRDGKRAYGHQIEIRCWKSVDARKAKPVRLDWRHLEQLSGRITAEIPQVVSVTYAITEKPPSTMEAV